MRFEDYFKSIAMVVLWLSADNEKCVFNTQIPNLVLVKKTKQDISY